MHKMTFWTRSEHVKHVSWQYVVYVLLNISESLASVTYFLIVHTLLVTYFLIAHAVGNTFRDPLLFGEEVLVLQASF